MVPPLEGIFYTALTLFILADPIGVAPAILALIHRLPAKRQQYVLFREGMIAFFIALVFLFVGEAFLELIEVKDYTVQYAGGIILVLVALPMIFGHMETVEKEGEQKEPFLVPIATPLLAGPALLTLLMLSSHQEGMNVWSVAIALTLAWIFVLIVLVLSPFLIQVLKKTGMIILEQLFGMLLLFIAVQMLVTATNKFLLLF